MKATLLTLTLLGLTLLTGSGHGMSENGKCETNVSANLKRFVRLSPMVRMMAEQIKQKGGIPWAMKKVQDGMRACVCKMVLGEDATNNATCSCMAEIENCEMQYKPTTSTAPADIKGQIVQWMDCMTQERLAAAIQCKEMVMTSPAQMVCMARGVKCTAEGDAQDEDTVFV